MTSTTNTPTALPANIACVGLGSMAGAIMQGLLRERDTSLPALKATTNSAASAARYDAVAGLSVAALETTGAANETVVRDAAVVLLGVKPWAITELLTDLRDSFAPHATVVSVAAGITLAQMRAALQGRDDVRLVRAMPNTPALIGKGVTGFAVEPGADPALAKLATALFSAVGDVVPVPEAQLDALSAVSGSGPAYLFWFVEQLTAAASRLGFDAETAKLLAENTVTGAAALLASGTKTAAEQRRAVTSPNGTTEQALKVFDEADRAALFDRALEAAIRRARELAAAN